MEKSTDDIFDFNVPELVLKEHIYGKIKAPRCEDVSSIYPSIQKSYNITQSSPKNDSNRTVTQAVGRVLRSETPLTVDVIDDEEQSENITKRMEWYERQKQLGEDEINILQLIGRYLNKEKVYPHGSKSDLRRLLQETFGDYYKPVEVTIPRSELENQWIQKESLVEIKSSEDLKQFYGKIVYFESTDDYFGNELFALVDERSILTRFFEKDSEIRKKQNYSHWILPDLLEKSNLKMRLATNQEKEDLKKDFHKRFFSDIEAYYALFNEEDKKFAYLIYRDSEGIEEIVKTIFGPVLLSDQQISQLEDEINHCNDKIDEILSGRASDSHYVDLKTKEFYAKYYDEEKEDEEWVSPETSLKLVVHASDLFEGMFTGPDVQKTYEEIHHLFQNKMRKNQLGLWGTTSPTILSIIGPHIEEVD